MTDILDSVLNLEEEYYTLGHQEGTLAGQTAGRLEGRAFGIETAFQKYLQLGIIKGRTKIWQSRLPSDNTTTTEKIKISNPRHIKHITLLQTLSTTPPIRNEEDDVEEVDDRIRRGKAKVKILENTLREGLPTDEEEQEQNEEEKGKKISRKSGSGIAIAGGAGAATGLETEFEDFKIRRS
ncbi:hypothetical protein TWF481_003281 [Arthrobotrys musiformis]|uniref:Essential protein Yae1 N-terminal domain-containing protein n=1 Tax=Arthrobotrys musiformis TaxID=47236 RepID=A0AAV9VPV6_9PEZI